MFLNSWKQNSSVRTVADSLIKTLSDAAGMTARQHGGRRRSVDASMQHAAGGRHAGCGSLDDGWRSSNGVLPSALVQMLQALISRANIDSWEDSSSDFLTLGEEKLPSAVWWQQFNPP